MSAVKEGCRKAFQNQHQRLVTPMYSCGITVNAEVLGESSLFFFFKSDLQDSFVQRTEG